MNPHFNLPHVSLFVHLAEVSNRGCGAMRFADADQRVAVQY